MLMFFVNILCIIFYFCLATVFLFFLYYFKILPITNCVIRYKYNILDFYLDFLKVLSDDIRNRDPDTFSDTGIIIYEGHQGSGKTMSMVYDVWCLQKKYPKALVIDNFGYSYANDQLVSPDQLVDYTNDKFGVITALDEMGILFNSRDYKHFSETGMLQVIFENRKVRRRLVGSSQRFGLIDKNIRLQTSEVRSCFTMFGVLSGYIRKRPTVNADGVIQKYSFKGVKLFIQSPELRAAYDTYFVIRKFNDESFKQ